MTIPSLLNGRPAIAVIDIDIHRRWAMQPDSYREASENFWTDLAHLNFSEVYVVRACAAQPLLSLLFCSARAHLWATSIPAGNKTLIDLLGLLNASAFLIPGSFNVVIIGAATLAACGCVSRCQLEPAQFCGMEGWTCPEVVLLLGQNMPDEDSELSRGGDRSDVLAAPRSDAQEERPQRTRRPRCRPGRFHE